MIALHMAAPRTEQAAGPQHGVRLLPPAHQPIHHLLLPVPTVPILSRHRHAHLTMIPSALPVPQPTNRLPHEPHLTQQRQAAIHGPALLPILLHPFIETLMTLRLHRCQRMRLPPLTAPTHQLLLHTAQVHLPLGTELVLLRRLRVVERTMHRHLRVDIMPRHQRPWDRHLGMRVMPVMRLRRMGVGCRLLGRRMGLGKQMMVVEVEVQETRMWTGRGTKRGHQVRDKDNSKVRDEENSKVRGRRGMDGLWVTQWAQGVGDSIARLFCLGDWRSLHRIRFIPMYFDKT